MIRGALLLLFGLACVYLGGMYWNPPLLLLAALVGILFLSGSLHLLWGRKRITAEILTEEKTAKKNCPLTVCIAVTYSGMLPPSFCSIRVTYGMQEEKPEKKTLHISLRGKKKGRAALEITPSYCGKLAISIESIRFGDWSGLLRGTKRVKNSENIFVLPKEVPGEIAVQRKELFWYPREGNVLEAVPGTEQSDYQLRTYREGDHLKNIHWKLEAKTGTLWTKAYEQESSGTVVLYLNLQGCLLEIQEKKSNFLEGAILLVRGILRGGQMVSVCWYHGGRNRFDLQEIRDEKDILGLFFFLADMPAKETELRKDWWNVLKEKFPGFPPEILSIDTGGRISVNETELAHLSEVAEQMQTNGRWQL